MTSVTNSSFSTCFIRAYDSLHYSAGFRAQPEDFRVDEILGFSFSGEGEHICFFIEKTSQNTHWVAGKIAEHYQINEYDVGFCGRKDRHAITRQWLSIYDPHRKVSPENFPEIEGVKLLESTRHHKKLRPGDHQTNAFVITLRNVCNQQGERLTDEQKNNFLERAENILEQGVPNYFGVQRFGREANNLVLAQAWFESGVTPPRKQKGMVLSAARSWVFNQVLAVRIRENCWRECIQGDLVENALIEDAPIEEGMPTGPLWGRGKLATTDKAEEIERRVQEQYAQWCERLEYQGLKQERRSLVLKPQQLSCQWQGEHFVLAFSLPSGTFATAVLDELVDLKTA
jgi:tRNA pseudouridine13 synthase